MMQKFVFVGSAQAESSTRSTPESVESVTQTKPKHSRTSAQKVRTGCITCKKRHVKCDESKPYCHNCLRSRGQCEGYVDSKKKRNGPVQVCWDSKEVVHDPKTQQLLDPDLLDFRHATDMLYFQEFVGLAQSPWITAASTGDFWAVTLPQLARNHGTLRNAAMAIGAMSMWHRRSAKETPQAVSKPILAATDDEHYLHAVAYYCQSLKLQSQRATPEDAVFLSILLLYFELLRGNRRAALDHVNHGLALFLALSTDGEAFRLIDNLAPDPKPLLGVVADIFSHLASQARTILPNRIANGPSLPNVVKGLKNKKQTMESFFVFLSKLPGSSVAIDDMPPSFQDLDEFEKYWVAARRGQIAMATIAMEIIRDSGVLLSKDEDFIMQCFTELLANPRVRDFCTRSKELMNGIDASFSPLFKKIIMSDPESPQYLRAIHLRLQFLVVNLFADPSVYTDVEPAESLTPMFRESLSLAEIALRHATRRAKDHPARQFSLQSEISWFLLMTSLFCRDPLLRDEATWMLKDYPGQDGLWNPRALYALAMKNRVLERENIIGTPAEQLRRLWRREFLFEDSGDRILIRYVGWDEVGGTWQLFEEVTDVPAGNSEAQWRRQPLTGAGGLLVGDLLDPERATGSVI
jgi:hypothetical protein